MTRWIPLESNPEYGLRSQFETCDNSTFDSGPIKLVWTKKNYNSAISTGSMKSFWTWFQTKRREEDDLIRSEASSPSLFNSVIWIKQTISNACGTIGLLHALANTGIKFAPGSPLAQFIEACKDKTPEERAEFLETTPLFAEIHAETASTGQSAVPTDLDTDLHFTCFVEAEMEGVPHVVELDGRRAGIMDRGKIYNDLLTDVASLVKETYIKGSSGSIQFSMTSLGPPAEW
ncbi:peptidase C12 ubiquitin carboxyl-terminal hydrolase 1 [Lentinula edodes]|uniref:Ubiquitin carboxyl-terminal hydrolase n=1 Tax=Lentinula edodes TaxID=5353 RepID=A0A1Q3ES04_LENED|nr:peptidase C12 ubiquitin carboxyl-terminal hydrolase 1 [Lentinula edodes]